MELSHPSHTFPIRLRRPRAENHIFGKWSAASAPRSITAPRPGEFVLSLPRAVSSLCGRVYSAGAITHRHCCAAFCLTTKLLRSPALGREPSILPPKHFCYPQINFCGNWLASVKHGAVPFLHCTLPVRNIISQQY